jgi:hypothetical protein
MKYLMHKAMYVHSAATSLANKGKGKGKAVPVL